MKYKAILIIGQTASGKTSLAHKLFESLHEKGIICEIVNLDAFQIYKDVSIGTAKPTKKEQTTYQYHGIDLCAANESMDANVFAKFAQNACKEICARGNLPVCVGGSGLYLRAFLHGLDSFPSNDPMIRSKIRAYAQENGWDKCYEWLTQIDPIRAKELHPNDHVRIERAIEIFEITKRPASDLQTKKAPLFNQNTHFDSFVIHTVIEKEALKKNILERTNQLFADGWIQEVTTLYQKFGADLNHFNSMRAIGYKSILSSLKCPPSCDLTMGLAAGSSELLTQITNETIKYAKRQKTWNKKEKVDFLINPENKDEFLQLIEAAIKFNT